MQGMIAQIREVTNYLPDELQKSHWSLGLESQNGDGSEVRENWDGRPAMGGEPSKADSRNPGRRGKAHQTWQTKKGGLSGVLRQKTCAVQLLGVTGFLHETVCPLDIPLQLKYTDLDRSGILSCE